MARYWALAFLLASQATAALAACREVSTDAVSGAACEFDPRRHEIRTFLTGPDDAPFGDFDRLKAALESKGESLAFAMNAGMYHADRTPVGLLIESGSVRGKLSTADGPGNFYMKPNGVFFIASDAGATTAHAASTDAYAERTPTLSILQATQSGPMLVIDGAIHPRFLENSESRKRRNGVGVRKDGAVVFAISNAEVSFIEFAIFFRDELDCPDALYLDGTISRLYAPELDRNDGGARMGPMIGVVAARNKPGDAR